VNVTDTKCHSFGSNQETQTHNTTDAMQGMLAVRRDADTSAVADGQYEAPHTNAVGRLKVSQWPGAYTATTGNITTSTGTVTADVTRAGSATVSVSGTYAGLNFLFEASLDGTNYVPIAGQRVDTGAFELTSGVIGSVVRVWDVTPLLGMVSLRVRATALTSGTAVMTIVPSATAIENAVQIVPSTNAIGSVILGNGTITNNIGTVSAVGSVANGATDSGNPVKVGGKAYTASPTAVTNAQRSDFITDKVGKQVVVQSIRDLKGDQATTITSSTTETTIVTAVASTFLDLYGLIITNTSATATEVIIRDVTAGTARFSFVVPPNDTRGFMLNESAAYKQTTVNTAWTAQCVTSVASIKINAMYVRNI